MPCFKPLKGYRSRELTPKGKRSIVFNPKQGYIDQRVDIPCGQCRFCRLERSRQWAIRCVHESKLHNENSFITLTYDDKKLPKNGSLQVKDFQDFMKRLRRNEEYSAEKEKKIPRKIRFFHCGEYGELHSRPHYHACLFGYDFTDKYHWETIRGQKYSRSAILEDLWTYGNSRIGNLTFESAAYVARYITKKITGPLAKLYYEEEDEETGQLKVLQPEYVTMSRRPGIAKLWFEKYKTDVFPSDFVLLERKNKYIKCKPPKFYTGQYEITDPESHRKLKIRREQQGKNQAHDNTYERLKVKEKIMEINAEQLKRNYENEV